MKEFIMPILVRQSPAVLLLAVSLSMAASSAVAQEAPRVHYQEIPEGAYSVVAQVRARPGKEDALRAATLPLIAKVRSDPKNLVYCSPGGPRQTWPLHLLRGLREPGRFRRA
ncbi:putative quinol monooxygenase [Bradyrhizobium ottawaense]|uniref:putative quinol monooxygenase n=1 Tax=Bradyrhizobium ottawaense TaxID=931866 RepID=UPI003514E01E